MAIRLDKAFGQIRAMAERSEPTPLFTRLVKETKAKYAKCPDREEDDNWRRSVEHVLRRARIYADALDGNRSAEELFRSFVAAFTGSDISTDILAPLEGVEFSPDAPLDFDSFRVTKFSEQELSTIIENDTREIFYPDSTLDMHLLSQYWWLVASEKNQPCYAGQLFKLLEVESGQSVERSYGHFPSAIARVLQALVLYDWDGISRADPRDVGRYLLDGQDSYRWLGFTLPFVLRSGGSLFRPPDQVPDISSLELVPDFDHDGVERGECPPMPIHYLNATETCSFSRTVTEFEIQLNTIRSRTARWQFIDVAVSYLVKAFFSDDLDQLLWHITAIEALLGQHTEALTETLARRCGLILGSSKEDRKKIHRLFKNLYALRSDVVHGNTKQKKAHERNLAIARYIARDVAVWFLQYLCFLAEDFPAKDERHPKRAELLSALEMKQEERERLSYLIGRVPCSFPGKQCWDKR